MLHFSGWKVVTALGLCIIGLVFALPNFLAKDHAVLLPDWLGEKQVNLGLDLQGGSHLLLEVGLKDVIRERIDGLIDAMRVALRNQKIGYTGLGPKGQKATVEIRDPARIADARAALLSLEQGLEWSENDAVIEIGFSPEALRGIKTEAIQQSIEVIRRRIDETGTREPAIQRQGEDRILVQLPGLRDPERVKSLLGRTAKLTLHLLDDTTPALYEERGKVLPAGAMLVPNDDLNNPEEPYYIVRKRVEVSGDRLKTAAPTFDQTSGQYVVSFTFDTIGAKKFGKVTQDHVGKRLAILLDDAVISAPRILQPILGGSGIITGRFTVDEANDLALLLQAGALPAPLTILEERSVGPSLGADSIAAGQIACIIGFVLVVVFMAVIYGFFGLLADIALVLNLFLILGAISALQATLTLPGIAGIVLTVGMAVDANVLIFERIREEIRSGRTPINAVESGYRQALKTIIDANVTTLIAAILLYGFGSGPVKGFAVTLSLGIMTSMFTAIVITRMMVVLWLRKAKPSSIPI